MDIFLIQSLSPVLCLFVLYWSYYCYLDMTNPNNDATLNPFVEMGDKFNRIESTRKSLQSRLSSVQPTYNDALNEGRNKQLAENRRWLEQSMAELSDISEQASGTKDPREIRELRARAIVTFSLLY